jgi:hypothetical protein
VVEADNWCLMREARDLLPSRGENWHVERPLDDHGDTWRPLGLAPEFMKRAWLRKNSELLLATLEEHAGIHHDRNPELAESRPRDVDDPERFRRFSPTCAPGPNATLPPPASTVPYYADARRRRSSE